MKKLIIISIVGVVIVLGGLIFFMMQGPDLSQFEHLKDPQITTKADQKVLVVEAKGAPNEVGGKAFIKLFFFDHLYALR